MYNRKYTLTLKPVLKKYKNDKPSLIDAFDLLLITINANNNHCVFEKEGTDSLHLHAIISCPLIKDKRSLTKILKGYHLHTEIIRYKDYDNIEDVWKRYIHKEESDSDRYTLLYGCMIPLDVSNVINFNAI